ncbi:UDP-4-amino-4,6-dideoxy-N-acetyl-beta-L-altrosamine transaminase [Gammaproteobacteria bacterium]|nr:UDP-4-amino-4,6-dideoxy-N-acetyl-beta-L-altrosamine transaminase [Gammaproteobacteria bacterium]
MINYGKQSISSEDIKSVTDVLKSDFLTQGPCVPKFEELFTQEVNAAYSTAVSSATAALHLACLALGLKEGDQVWTSPNSFVASANCALYCGASVDFVDISPLTFNIDVNLLAIKLDEASKRNALPKIIIPVHFAGLSADMQRIKDLSNKYGFSIIEDASHATGGSYKEYKVGSCQFSDIAVFSFHPVKIITSGEGGMLCTNNKKLDQKIKLLRSHGITKDANEMLDKNSADLPWYYEQNCLGFNYRLTDIQAALGISQLSRVQDFIHQRATIASIYQKELADLPLQLQQQSDDIYSAWHLFVVRVKSSKSNAREHLYRHLKENGIYCQIHYIPIPSQPYYQSLGFDIENFPNTKQYYQECISLPVYPDLNHDDLNFVIKNIKNFFDKN